MSSGERPSNLDLASEHLIQQGITGRPTRTLAVYLADSIYRERIQELMRWSGSPKYKDPDDVLMKGSARLAILTQDRYRPSSPPRFNTALEVLRATLDLSGCLFVPGEGPTCIYPRLFP